MKRRWVGRFPVVGMSVLVLELSSCASADSKREGETHFLCANNDECRTHPDFGDGYECVAKSCKKVETRQSFSICDSGASMTCFGPGGCVGRWNCGADAGANVCECPVVEPDASIGGPEASTGILQPIVRPVDGGSCWESTRAPEFIVQRIYVLFDQSQKMGELVPGSSDSWWQAVVGGVTDFSNGSLTDAVEMGIQYFPLGSAPESCQAAYDTPEVGLTRVADDATAILTSLGGHSPAGSSSIGPALVGAIAHAHATESSPGALNHVVLVTNGPPVDCTPATISELASLAGAAAKQVGQVFTSVVALGDAAGAYDAFGVVSSDAVISIPGGDVRRGVSDAFEQVIGAGMECRWDLPDPGTIGPYDDTAISAWFEMHDGTKSSVTRVAGSPDCSGLDRDGIYIDHSTSHPVLIACPSLCAHPRSYKFVVSNCAK